MATFGATVWVHGREGSRLADRVELMGISGRDIIMEFILYMLEHGDDPCVLERFIALTPETPYRVLGRYWWADGEFDLELTSWVECTDDDATSEKAPVPDLWEIFCAGGERLQYIPF